MVILITETNLFKNRCGKSKDLPHPTAADVMVTLQAHKEMTLEECLEYIAEDELVEITPENIRMRKQDLVKFKSI